MSFELLNLIDNAAKYSAVGGVITPRAHKADDASQIVFEVEDQGLGLQPKELERIFEPFRTNEQRLKDAPPGTGLGLTICQKLVAALGDTIDVESNPGKGSCFRFDIRTE